MDKTLVERLRDLGDHASFEPSAYHDAADAIEALQAQLAEARRAALEEAAQCCDDEADRCDDAVKWGGSRRYIQNCKAAAYAMRDRAYAIRALAEKP